MGDGPGDPAAVIVVEFRHTHLSRNGPVAYAGAKGQTGGPTEAQKWKIQKLCRQVGRDADALIPRLRSVSEASGIRDQLMAEAKSKGV